MARISVESAKFYALTGLVALAVSGGAWAETPKETPWPVQLAANSPAAPAGLGSVNAIRIGVHPGKMRIVLDISEPTDMGFEVADDGMTVVIKMPASAWKAGAFTKRHARGMLSDYLYTPSESGGGRLALFMNRPVRIERPFLVAPGGKRGYRLVIDAVPAAEAAARPAPRAIPQPAPLSSNIHQLVGARLPAGEQLPPDTVHLAAVETAQTRLPPPRPPYQVPAQPPRQAPFQAPRQAPGPLPPPMPVQGGGQPARLEHQDAAVDQPGLEQGQRHAGGLAGAGRRLKHGAALGRDRRQKFGQRVVDGKGQAGRHAGLIAE